jgi:hypothetical protein
MRCSWLLSLLVLSSCLPDSDRPPEAIPKEVNVKQNSTNNEILLEGKDPDNDPVIFKVTGHPSHGTFLLGDPSNGLSQVLFYTPNSDYVGVDAITYTSTDGLYFSAPATLSISVQVE